MRPSSRKQILQAAVRVTARAGITALTLEAAAEEAGLTKAGLMYHFRTREDLLRAIQRHLIDAWEDHLLAELGKPLDEATPRERAAAYVRFGPHDTESRAELAFMVEAAAHPELTRAWEELAQRWVPRPATPDPEAVELFLARLAADGLWLLAATSPGGLDPQVTEALIERIAALTDPAAGPAV
ncbi:TetR family transcriptional regulator [Streptomyces sp. MP131-18]|uniref:TetR/AcrR family transcriptional regulator n=1 Tax=Streptomyces sp. MP131-18 TaxID=1857892 RepID=UPI00097C1D3D|nr:TetR family transcriptional regulator [Streptomyces sp. MP131-18]